MAKQTRPFIVEIKTSRKPKPVMEKPSIWGTLDLKPDTDLNDGSKPGMISGLAGVPDTGRAR